MALTHVHKQFDRTLGCTAAELIGGLTRALRNDPLAVDAKRFARQNFFDLYTRGGG
jgi:hypothetical protein